MSKKALKNGTYRTAASVKICHGERVLTLKELRSKIRASQKVLSCAVKKHPDTKVVITGMQNSRLEEIQILRSEGRTTEAKPLLVIDGLVNPELKVILDSPQFELDDDLAHARCNIIADEFKNDLTSANKLANALANSSTTAEGFELMLENVDNPETVRKLVALSAEEKVNVQFEDGSEIAVGGQLAVPEYLPHEETIAIDDCTVIQSLNTGMVTILQKGVQEPLNFHVQSRDIKLFLIYAAEHFQWGLQCKLIRCEDVEDKAPRYNLIALKDRNSFIHRLIEELQSHYVIEGV